jgi:hypothetical protein
LPDVGLVFAVVGIGEQFVDELGPLVRLAAVEKSRRLLGGRNVTGNVEVDATVELGVVAARRGSDLVGTLAAVDGFIDVSRQRTAVQLGAIGEG